MKDLVGGLVKGLRVLSVIMLVGMLSGLMAQSQVTISFISSPNPSPFVKDMISSRGLVSLTLTNTSTNTITGKLLGNVTFKGEVISKTDFTTVGVNEITLAPGASVVKYADDFIDFSNFELGAFAETVLRTGALLAGDYNGCVTFFDATTQADLSGLKCFKTAITDYSPPELYAPANNAILTEVAHTFNWSKLNPSYNGVVSYTLKVWELYPGEVPSAIIQYDNNLVVTKENIPSESTALIMNAENLQEDRQYIWTVQAFTATDDEISTQAVPRYFKYGKNYSKDLLTHIELLELHEEFAAMYLEGKRRFVCDEESFDKVKKDLMPRFEKAGNDLLQKIQDNPQLFAAYNLNANVLSGVPSAVKNLTKETVVTTYERYGGTVTSFAFGEQIKTKINEIKPGAYPFTLLDLNEKCDDLTNKKKPKQTKAEIKKEKEDDLIEKLAIACDYSASTLERASASILLGSTLKKEFPKVRKAGMDTYTKYTKVNKKVSKKRLAEEKIQKGFKELNAAFVSISTLAKYRKDKELAKTKGAALVPDVIQNLKNAGNFFRGKAPVNRVKKELPKLVVSIESVEQNLEKKGVKLTYDIKGLAEQEADSVYMVVKDLNGNDAYNANSEIIKPLKDDNMFVIKGLQEGYAYTLKVVVKSNDGRSSSASKDFFVKYILTPNAPSNLHHVSVTDNSLTIKWDAPILSNNEENYTADITHYIVRVADSPKEYQVAGTKTSLKIKNLEEKTDYYVSVVAKNSAGNSRSSNQWGVTTLERVLQFTYFTASSTSPYGSDKSLDLTWDFNMEQRDVYVESYILSYGGKIVDVPRDAKRIALEYVKDGITIGVDKIQAVLSNGETISSPPLTWELALNIQSLDHVKEKKEVWLTYNLEGVVEKEAQEIDLKLLTADGKPALDSEQNAFVPVKSGWDYVVKGLDGGTYKFEIAVNLDDGRSDSKTGEITIPTYLKPEAPTNLKSGTITDNSAKITWEAPSLLRDKEFFTPKITTYFVQVHDGIDSTTLQVSGDENSFTIPNLLESTKYTISVRAKNLEALSPSSNKVEITTKEKIVQFTSFVVSPSISNDSIQLKWSFDEEDTKEISSYVLSYAGKDITVPKDAKSLYLKYIAGELEIGIDRLKAVLRNGNTIVSPPLKGSFPVLKKETETVKKVKKPIAVVQKQQVITIKDCFFANVNSTATQNSSGKTHNQLFSWSENGKADQVKITWYEANNPKAKGEKVVPKNTASYKLEMASNTDYIVSLVAIKGGKEIATAKSIAIRGNTNSIILNCTKESEGSAIKEVVKKEDPVQTQQVITVKDCFFNNAKSTGTANSNGRTYNQVYTWSESGKADQVKITWYEANNPNAKGEKVIPPNTTTYKLEMASSIDYVVSLVAIKGGKEIAKAQSIAIRGKANSIILNCTKESEGSAIKKVVKKKIIDKPLVVKKTTKKVEEDKCYFSAVSTTSKAWGGSHKVHDHNIEWQTKGTADQLRLVWYNIYEPNSKKEKLLKENARNIGMTLNDDDDYIVSLSAIKGGKVVSRAVSKSVKGGVASIALDCTDDLDDKPVYKTKAKTSTKTIVQVNNDCFFSNVVSTGSTKSSGITDHTFSWEENSKADKIKIKWQEASNPDAAAEMDVANGAKTVKVSLRSDVEYVVSLVALSGSKEFAEAKASSIGNASQIRLVCAAKSTKTSGGNNGEDAVKDCFFTDVKSSSEKNNFQTTWHTFTWKENGSSDFTFINWKFSNGNGEQRETIPKGTKSVKIELQKNYEYEISLHAYNNKEHVATAESQKVKGGESSIKLVCNAKSANSANNKKNNEAAKKTEQALAQKCVVFDIATQRVKQVAGGNTENTITWKIKPSVTSYKLEIQNVNNTSDRQVGEYTYNKKRTEPFTDGRTAKLKSEEKYVMTLLVFSGSAQIAKAVSKPTLGKSNFSLSCGDNSITTKEEIVIKDKTKEEIAKKDKTKEEIAKKDKTKEEIAKKADAVDCFFKDVKSIGVKKTDKTVEHTFTWEENGDADKVEIIKFSKQTFKMEKLEVQKGSKTVKIELNSETDYWIAVVAYKDNKEFSRADNFLTKGGANSIEVVCNALEKQKEKEAEAAEKKKKAEVEAAEKKRKEAAAKELAKKCAVFDIATQSVKPIAGGKTKNTIYWTLKPNVTSLTMVLQNVNKPDDVQRAHPTYNKNDGKPFTEGIFAELKSEEKYILTLIAFSGNNQVGKAVSAPTLGKSNFTASCTEGGNISLEEADNTIRKAKLAEINKDVNNSTCYFQFASSTSKKISDRESRHTFTWKTMGSAGYVKLRVTSRDPKNPSKEDMKEYTVSQEINSINVFLRHDREYSISLRANYKGEYYALQAHAINKGWVLGSIKSIYLACGPDSKNTANTDKGPLGAGCLITDVSSTSVPDGANSTIHNITFKSTSNRIKQIYIQWYELGDNKVQKIVIANETNLKVNKSMTYSHRLLNDKKYVISLIADGFEIVEGEFVPIIGSKLGKIERSMKVHRITKVTSKEGYGSSKIFKFNCETGDTGK